MSRRLSANAPFVRKTMAAMRRAARAARDLAEKTGTPLYVLQDGRIVNLNPKGRLKKPRRSRPTG